METTTFKHITDIFKKLGVLNSQKQLNLNLEFSTLDIEKLIDDYKNLDAKALNQLLKSNLKRKNKNNEIIEFTTRTMTALINRMLQDFFNYKIDNIKTSKKTINGKRRKIQIYKIKSNRNTDLMTALF